MRKRLVGTPTVAAAAVLLFRIALLAGEPPVAYWNFDRIDASKVTDVSGNNNHGVIHGGARWIKSGAGHALQFDGVDDYVDCGNGSELDLRGPMTLELWLHPDAPPAGEPGVAGKFYESYVLTYYKTGSAYFYIRDGGNASYGQIRVGEWTHVAGVFDGKMMRFYVNGRETSANPSKYQQPAAGKNFLIGVKFGDPDHRDEAMRGTEFFTGAIDDVRLYDRALTPDEIIEHFNELAAEKNREPFDTSLFDRLALRTFVYPDKSQAIVEASYRWIRQMPPEAHVKAELLSADGKTLHTATVKTDAADRVAEATFPLDGLADGEYVLRAAVIDSSDAEHQKSEERFTLPLPAPTVPSPNEKTAGPLPPPYAPPKYEANVAPPGGITVTVGGKTYVIESSFSYPHGGDNLMSVKKPEDAKPESDWRPHVRKIDDTTWQVHAEGKHYSLDRRVKLTPTRIEVADTITNKTDDVIGVILSNHIDTRGLRDGVKHMIPPNPTVFASSENTGLGLIALDDLYQLQMRTYYAEGRAYLKDEHFGLDKRASYTIEWAAYPTGSADYFDFINQVRKDEGLNGRVEGGLELTSRWGPPPADSVKNKAIKYVSVAYQTNAMENPHVSIEGWEFMEYPQMQDRLRQAIADTRAAYPDMFPMFHVAHSLYATNRPKEQFPDSYALDENGNLIHYGPNSLDYYGNYFPKEMVEAGWRWFLFYPTMENSFGKLMLEATDYMIDNLGARAIWADGFIGGYIPGEYIYNFFDGHSVTIDPNTKLVTRQKAQMTYLSLPVLKEVVRKFDEAGGVVITNDIAPPRSMWRMHMITSNETGGGDQQPIASMYLGHTVTPLGNPTTILGPRDVYPDILAKLDLGALYFWYGERDYVTEPTLVSHMYPITFESIRPGTVRGVERIVTKTPGVYGWPDDRSLHAVYSTDARGRLRPNTFVTTVDSDGVRTDLPLADKQAAAIVKIPVEIESASPVNVIVRQFGDEGVTLMLNGAGNAAVRVREAGDGAGGGLRISPDGKYQVSLNDAPTESSHVGAALEIKLTLPGEPTTLRIQPQP